MTNQNSQNEAPDGEAFTTETIDELIADVTDTQIREAASVPPGVQPFDFRRPNKFSREHVRALSLLSETFARQIANVLSTTLRSVSQVRVASVDQLSYDDYITSSPNPSLLTVVSLEPLSGAGILQIPLPLTMSIVDRLLGGSGTGPYPSRALTDVEEGLITEVLDRCLAELAAAFDSLVSLEPKIVELESNPQFAQVAAPSDMVVVVVFDTSVGVQEGEMSLCIPFVTLEPRLEAITGHSLSGERRFADLVGVAAAMERALRDVPVDIAVRFAPVTLTSREVVNLEVGDVLPLRHPSDRPLAVLAGGVPLLPAVAGRKRNRLACRIVDSDLEGVS